MKKVQRTRGQQTKKTSKTKQISTQTLYSKQSKVTQEQQLGT